MIVWITSSGRSGNTFFRVVMHQLYGMGTYAAFQASEVLVTAGAEELVGHKKLPPALQTAINTGNSEKIRLALEALEAGNELFVFKTHAMAHELFGTKFRAHPHRPGWPRRAGVLCELSGGHPIRFRSLRPKVAQDDSAKNGVVESAGLDPPREDSCDRSHEKGRPPEMDGGEENRRIAARPE